VNGARENVIMPVLTRPDLKYETNGWPTWPKTHHQLESDV